MIRTPDAVERKWAWLPKRMTSEKLLLIGFYYECTIVKHGADPRHRFWIKSYYTEREYFLKKLTN